MVLRESDTTQAELSRRLGWHREKVDRLEAAFRALQYELDLDIHEQPRPKAVKEQSKGRRAG
jgi:hypothetical protein